MAVITTVNQCISFTVFITALCFIFLIRLLWPKNHGVCDTVFEKYSSFSVLFCLVTKVGFPLDLRGKLPII